jgi:hypothetical protein
VHQGSVHPGVLEQAGRSWHYETMSVVESVTEVVTAIGGLGGIAAVINAISAWRSQEGEKSAAAPEPPSPRVGHAARWCLILGAGACLIAGALLVIVGTTTVALDRIPIVLLEWGVVAFAVLAIPVSARTLRNGARERQVDLMFYAGTGLVASVGALAVTFIAGTG